MLSNRDMILVAIAVAMVILVALAANAIWG
jgi:hypothetical protein